MKSTDAAYGTTARSLHWISAGLILILLITGFRAGFTDGTAIKSQMLRIHLPTAGLVLILTIGRLIWWARFDRKPAEIGGIPDWQATAARWTHRGLYVLIFAMLGSGIAMSVMSGLPDALFGTAVFPALADLPPRAGHGIGGRLIAAAILLHAGAAVFHHVVLKDCTLRRMLPGGKVE